MLLENISDRSLLFEFWDNLVNIKEIDFDTFKQSNEHPIRKEIVKILRRGIKDGDRKRHALSMKEILDEINQLHKHWGKEAVKMTSLYYHRDLLIENKQMQEVAVFLEGKRHVSYYGRTAKGFIASDLSNEDFLNFNSHIINLIQEFNPDMPKDEIINLFKHMKSKFDKQHQLIKNWIEENSNILLKLDIDIIDIYEKISTIYSYKKEIIEFNDEFARLLHLPDYF